MEAPLDFGAARLSPRAVRGRLRLRPRRTNPRQARYLRAFVGQSCVLHDRILAHACDVSLRRLCRSFAAAATCAVSRSELRGVSLSLQVKTRDWRRPCTRRCAIDTRVEDMRWDLAALQGPPLRATAGRRRAGNGRASLEAPKRSLCLGAHALTRRPVRRPRVLGSAKPSRHGQYRVVIRRCRELTPIERHRDGSVRSCPW